MFINKTYLSTYQHQLQTYPQIYPQLIKYVFNKVVCAFLSMNIHLSTLTTTRTTSIYMINNMKEKIA